MLVGFPLRGHLLLLDFLLEDVDGGFDLRQDPVRDGLLLVQIARLEGNLAVRLRVHLLLGLAVPGFALVGLALRAELLQGQGHARTPGLVAIIVHEAEYLVLGACLGEQTFALARDHCRLQLFIAARVDLDADVFAKVDADGPHDEVLAVIDGEELVLDQVRLEPLIGHQLEQLVDRDGDGEAIFLVWVIVCAENDSLVFVVEADVDGGQHRGAPVDKAQQTLRHFIEKLFHVV